MEDEKEIDFSEFAPQSDVKTLKCINCWNECELNQKGWVMNCKHIVCNECIENNDESSIMCSICQTEKDYTTDFQHTIYDSGMDDDREYIEQLQQKLIGLNPQLINEMATNAINFWIFQKQIELAVFENAYQDKDSQVSQLTDKVEKMNAEKANLKKQLFKTKQDFQKKQEKFDKLLKKAKELVVERNSYKNEKLALEKQLANKNQNQNNSTKNKNTNTNISDSRSRTRAVRNSTGNGTSINSNGNVNSNSKSNNNNQSKTRRNNTSGNKRSRSRSKSRQTSRSRENRRSRSRGSRNSNSNNNNNGNKGDNHQEMRSPPRKRTRIQDRQSQPSRAPRAVRGGSCSGSGGRNGYGVTRQTTPPVGNYSTGDTLFGHNDIDLGMGQARSAMSTNMSTDTNTTNTRNVTSNPRRRDRGRHRHRQRRSRPVRISSSMQRYSNTQITSVTTTTTTTTTALTNSSLRTQ